MWLITEVLPVALAIVALMVVGAHNVVLRKHIRKLRREHQDEQTQGMAVEIAKLSQIIKVALQVLEKKTRKRDGGA